MLLHWTVCSKENIIASFHWCSCQRSKWFDSKYEKVLGEDIVMMVACNTLRSKATNSKERPKNDPGCRGIAQWNACLECMRPWWFGYLTLRKPGVYTIIWALRRWREDDQKFKVIFGLFQASLASEAPIPREGGRERGKGKAHLY